MYGHAERARITAQRAIAETVELLLTLPSLDQDQLRFVQEYAPERLRSWRPRTTCAAERGSTPSPGAHRSS